MAKQKKGSEIAACVYKRTNLPDKDRKALRLRLCGKTILFADDEYGRPVPRSAMRCGLRLCPSCSWIRARKIFGNVYNIITHKDFSGKQFIFLTLTVKNCGAGLLEGEIKRLLSAWQKLTENKRADGFTKSFAGTFRALEVTYNKKTKKYHPHLHAMAAVDPGYFRKSNKNYISQKRLRELWRDACGLDYLPQCRARQRNKDQAGRRGRQIHRKDRRLSGTACGT